MKLQNRVVIITGASSGIGAAAARAFSSAGARVVLAARDAGRLDAVAAGLNGPALCVPTDVADRDAAFALAEAARQQFGQIDVVVHNAGLGLSSPVEQLAAADVERAFAVNLLGPLHLVQATLPHMQRGSQQVIVSSVVGWRSLPYQGAYAGSKAALDRMAEALRVELRPRGIGVTLVRPGTTATEFGTRKIGAGHEHRRVSTRGVPPEQVAAVIVRATDQRKRVAYVRLADRLNVLVSLLLPGVTDWALGRAIQWRDAPHNKGDGSV